MYEGATLKTFSRSLKVCILSVGRAQYHLSTSPVKVCRNMRHQMAFLSVRFTTDGVVSDSLSRSI